MSRNFDANDQAKAGILAEPINLLVGYDSVSGLVRPSIAVKSDISEKIDTTCPFELKVSISMEQLATSLYYSQSVSASYMGGNASAKVQYMNTVQQTTFAVTMSVYTSKTSRIETILNPEFKRSIGLPQNDQEANEFFAVFGDAFISSYRKGGEYIALYTFFCSDRTEQESLAAQISMDVGKGFASGSSEAQLALDTLLREVKVTYQLSQYMSGQTGLSFPQGSGIFEFAQKYPSHPMDAPAIITFGTTGYESVYGNGNAFAKIAANRKYFIGNQNVDGLAKDLVRIDESLKQMDQIYDIYKFYGFESKDATLVTSREQAIKDIDTIKQQMDDYSTNPTAAFVKPELPTRHVGAPILKSKGLLYSDKWGGNGGSPFNDVNLETFFKFKTCMKAISLRAGKRVDQLRTEYRQTNPDQSIGTPQSFICKRGGGGGGDTGTYQLNNYSRYEESVVRISGRSGEKLDQVVIEFGVEGNKISGGGSGGSSFGPWQPPTGSIVLGFYGRCGEEIDQLGAVYSYLLAAEWDVD